MHELLNKVAQKSMKPEIPEFNIGDTVRVMVRVTEKGEKDKVAKTRLQAYEGVVIAMSGGGLSETIKVRRVTHGVGIERTFPVHSPIVDDIIVVRHGKTRRAKLYYLRSRVGKKARVKEQSRDTVVAREQAKREKAEAAAAAAAEAARVAAEAAAAEEAAAKAAAEAAAAKEAAEAAEEAAEGAAQE